MSIVYARYQLILYGLKVDKHDKLIIAIKQAVEKAVEPFIDSERGQYESDVEIVLEELAGQEDCPE